MTNHKHKGIGFQSPAGLRSITISNVVADINKMFINTIKVIYLEIKNESAIIPAVLLKLFNISKYQ